MRKLIEFQLHAGRVPYFVEETCLGLNFNNLYYGISLDDELSYLPETILVFNKLYFINKVKLIEETKIDSKGEITILTEEEKLILINDWILKIGYLE